MKKKLIAVLLVATFVVSSLAGCSTPNSAKKSDTSTSDEKVLRYALKAEPPTLDPQLANSIPSATVGFHICDGLMRNNEGKIVPGAAESYEMSDDGLTYTFKLKDNLKWSDGEKITADQFVYGMQRLLDPATASEYAFIGMILKNAEKVNSGEVPVTDLGVKAIDDTTLEIQLEYPAGYFLSMLSMTQFCPTRQDLVEKYGKDFAADPDKNVYSGPFMVTDWAHGDRITLSKNPNYWDADNIKLDKVEIITVADANTQVAMYEEGELDFVEVPTELSANYADKTTSYYDGANDFVKLNMDGSSALSNKNLRLALNYAMNRADYVQLTTGGIYDANTRYVLPQVNGVKGDYGDEYPYEAFPLKGDAAKAKDYLTKAIAELGVASAADVNLELLTGDTEQNKKEVEVIQAQLQDTLGIKITIKQVPYKQRLEMENKHEFQMVVSGWVPDYSDPYSYLELWTTDSTYNQISYSSAAYDGYMKSSQTLTDPKERLDALFNAEKTLCEDAAIMPLQLRKIEMMKSDKLEGMNTYFVGYNYDYMYADITK